MSRAVLLVDDDPSILRLAESILQKQNFEVMTASNGREAVELLSQRLPDVVVTDLDMPEMGGRDLLKHCRRMHGELPVVILTGSGSEEDAIQCFREGAADYVVKAQMKTEIVDVLERLLVVPEPEETQSPEPPVASSSPETTVVEKKAAAIPIADEPQPEPVLQEYLVKKRRNATLREPDSKASLRTEFIVRKWNLNQREVQGESAIHGSDRTIDSARLAALHRQAARLKKWGELIGGSKKEIRRNVRRLLADVVEIIPVDYNGERIDDEVFEAFCKDVSTCGCGLLHHRPFSGQQCVIRFPHLTDRPTSLLCKIVRSRLVATGVYEVGLKFLSRVESAPLSKAR